MKTLARSLGIMLAAGTLSFAQAPKAPQTAAAVIKAELDDINRKILEMAKDFPADKYDYKMKPEMRSFRELIVHIAAGNSYAGKAGKGEANAKWEEADIKTIKDKAAAVALYEKSVAEADAGMKASPEGPKKNLEPYISVMEHDAEHYGLLVGYYRANGLVPPESLPKK
jgi:DinB family protein